MSRTEYHKRRVPLEVQGVVIDGEALGSAVYVPLRDGMTLAKAAAYSEELIQRARKMVNYRVTEADAYEFAIEICNRHEALRAERGDEGLTEFEKLQFVSPHLGPCAHGWLKAMGRTFSFEDQRLIAQWVYRVFSQRSRLACMQGIMAADDPEALAGLPKVEVRSQTPSQLVRSVRIIAGKTPLHSEITQEYFAAKKRSKNYKRALEQFREQCGDLEIHEYTPDHCWSYRNWLSDTLDEKKGEKLSGQTKVHKLSAVRSLFEFAIEKRHRNDNPMREVKTYSKKENIKKRRRLYSPNELRALFVDGEREGEWKYWSPLLGIYSGVRITESIQLRPRDVSDTFGIWHIIIQPGRGQNVKGDKARVVPIHRELVRLGFIKLANRAVKEKREWLFADVPLVAKPGIEYNAPDEDTIMVPSQNAATQWFGRYSDACGVTDPNVDFHALRGAFTTYGSQQGRDLSLRMELVGHSKGSGVHNRYIYEGPPLEKLKAEVDAIKYPIHIPSRGTDTFEARPKHRKASMHGFKKGELFRVTP